MKCFFDGVHGAGECAGAITMSKGNYFAPTGYCAAHRIGNLNRGFWGAVRSVSKKITQPQTKAA